MSDLEGLNTVRMDNSAQSRHRLVLRLRAAGVDPDTEGVDWLNEGNFDLGEAAAAQVAGEPDATPPAADFSDAAVLRDFLEIWGSIDQPFTPDQFTATLGVSDEDAEWILTDLERQGPRRCQPPSTCTWASSRSGRSTTRASDSRRYMQSPPS
jgi:hypothetical protein